MHPKTLLVAALTAVTLAIISAKLTGIVSSLMLVALASIMTAAISEFYRVTFERINSAAKKVALKTVNARMAEITGEQPIITAATMNEETVSENNTEDKNRFKATANRLLRSRWAIPLVFLLTATFTVMGVYFVGQANEPELQVVQQVIERKDISKARENRIKEEAQKEAVEAATAAKNENATALTTTKEELQQEIIILRTELTELQTINNTQTETIEGLLETITSLETIIEKLEGRLKELENKIEEPSTTTSDPPAEDNGGATPPQ